MYELNKIARALTDKNRLLMLKLLTEKDICVCEMNEIFPLSHSQISRNLQALFSTGFLKRWHDGKCVVYIADRTESSKCCQAIIELVTNCLNDDELLHNLRDKLQKLTEAKVREKSK